MPFNRRIFMSDWFDFDGDGKSSAMEEYVDALTLQ